MKGMSKLFRPAVPNGIVQVAVVQWPRMFSYVFKKSSDWWLNIWGLKNEMQWKEHQNFFGQSCQMALSGWQLFWVNRDDRCCFNLGHVGPCIKWYAVLVAFFVCTALLSFLPSGLWGCAWSVLFYSIQRLRNYCFRYDMSYLSIKLAVG